MGAQWLSGRVFDSRPKGLGFEPHQRHCVVSLSKNINLSLVLVQPRKICPYTSERLLMGRKESNQTNKQIIDKVGLTSQPPYCFKCKVQNSELLAFCRHDLIIFNNFPKILIDKKSKTEEINHKLGNYVEENNFFCKSLILFP